jgi:hypothetical protein
LSGRSISPSDSILPSNRPDHVRQSDLLPMEQIRRSIPPGSECPKAREFQWCCIGSRANRRLIIRPLRISCGRAEVHRLPCGSASTPLRAPSGSGDPPVLRGFSGRAAATPGPSCYYGAGFPGPSDSWSVFGYEVVHRTRLQPQANSRPPPHSEVCRASVSANREFRRFSRARPRGESFSRPFR